MAATATPAAATRKRGHSPLLLIILGLIVLFFWLIGTMFEIQTSEAFILGGASTAPNWGILMQPIEFAHGELSMDMAKAMMWGFGVELIYLIFVIAFTIAHEVLGRSHEWVGRVFATLAMVIVGFNALSNFQYGMLPSGFWGQLGFAVITAFVTAFFGVIGIRLMEVAIGEMRK